MGVDIKKRELILKCLLDGNSVRGTARIAGCSKNTVLSALCSTGEACKRYHNDIVRGFGDDACNYVQIDELWCNSGIKDEVIWVWVAICEETKLVPSWCIGGRVESDAKRILDDLSMRVGDDRLIQITTDGHPQYRDAIENAFGSNASHAILKKVYEARVRSDRFKICIDVERRVIRGNPDMDRVTTSHVERQNLTMRQNMRRMTRKSTGLSKKIENHGHAVALHFFYMNFVRIHSSLRVTPIMAAGVDTRVWDVSDMVDLSVYY